MIPIIMTPKKGPLIFGNFQIGSNLNLRAGYRRSTPRANSFSDGLVGIQETLDSLQRDPLKGMVTLDISISINVDIDVNIEVEMDVDMDVDLDIAVSINRRSPVNGVIGLLHREFGVDTKQV